MAMIVFTLALLSAPQPYFETGIGYDYFPVQNAFVEETRYRGGAVVAGTGLRWGEDYTIGVEAQVRTLLLTDDGRTFGAALRVPFEVDLGPVLIGGAAKIGFLRFLDGTGIVLSTDTLEVLSADVSVGVPIGAIDISLRSEVGAAFRPALNLFQDNLGGSYFHAGFIVARYSL